MTQGHRVRELRKSLDFTLEKFGKKLGVGKTAISNIENETRNLTEQMLLSICREFNVNEEWLRDGTGEMFRAEEENSIIAKATMLLGEKDPLFEAFIDTYSKLTPKNRELLYQFMTDFSQALTDKKKE